MSALTSITEFPKIIVLSKAKPDVLNCLAMHACVHAMREYIFLDPIVGLILVVFSGRGCVD